MIISVSISNFRSFFTEETLSLTASKKLADRHNDHKIAIPNSDQNVLKIGLIYGANGAGKSNTFKALQYIKSIALEQRKNAIKKIPFKLDGNIDDPSTFDIQFIAGQNVYRFGFKINNSQIEEEWLTILNNGKEKTLYERITEKNGNVKIEAPGFRKNKKLSALITVGGQPQQSFLATINHTLNKSDYGKHLINVLTWFEKNLILIDPDAQLNSLGQYLANNPDCLKFAGSFLKSVSTGVDHLQIHKNEITREELNSLLPNFFISHVLKGMNENQNDSDIVVIKLPNGTELVIERGNENHLYRIKIDAAHQNKNGSIVPFELNEESDGTKRLLNLMPVLYHPYTDETVFFIDEIDRSLHPNLVWEFVDFFLKSNKQAHTQIILTTHESNLLDLELLRRDEIWFAEKDQNSATHLYALTDFKIRNDLEIRKHYLNGRFGAIPFLGDAKRLIDNIPHEPS